MVVPHVHTGMLVDGNSGRRSLRLRLVSNCQLGRRLCGLLRHNPIRG
jgi:hypothetical protein